MAVLRALCPASLRFLDFIWQLRNSLLADPDWQRERLAQQCDLNSTLDVQKWLYDSRVVSYLVHQTCRQSDKVVAGTGDTISLLQAAIDTCPLRCSHIDEVPSTQNSQNLGDDEVVTLQHTLEFSLDGEIDHTRPLEPEPP